MLRLISILFVLAGLALLGLGALNFYADKGEAGYEAASDTAAYEADTYTESAPYEAADDVTESQPYAAETYSMDAPPEDGFSAEGPVLEDGMAEVGSGMADDEAPSAAGRTAATRAARSERFSTASAPQSMLDRLRDVPIAHETPGEARYNRAFEVTVAIDATGDTTAADALPGTGNIAEGTAQVLDKAQATLSGSAFDITLVSPAIQTVSPVTENVWRWKVMPVEMGTHELRIELFAMDGDEALPVRTFRDTVEVKVSRLGQVIAAADTYDPLFMIVGGIGSLLAGLFGVFRFFRGR